MIYHLTMTDGSMLELHNPVDMPEAHKIETIRGAVDRGRILVPDEYLGSVLKLCEDRRGRQKELTYAGALRDGRLRTAAERVCSTSTIASSRFPAATRASTIT